LLNPDLVIGNAIHWPGMAKPINATGDAGFARVASALRGWQNYHMDVRGWSDIAYGMGFDQAGRIWTLRGINIRTGANGDATVNSKYGAFLLILGPGEEPSAAMQRAVKAAQADFCRRFRRAPDRPTTHSRVRPAGTSCPGERAIRAVDAGKFDAGTSIPTIPTQPKDEDMPLTQADKDFITGECQRYAVANNNYTRQVLSTATKAILNEINEVDEKTAAAVESRLQDEFLRIQTEVEAEAREQNPS
jgi:hypothetical protein